MLVDNRVIGGIIALIVAVTMMAMRSEVLTVTSAAVLLEHDLEGLSGGFPLDLHKLPHVTRVVAVVVDNGPAGFVIATAVLAVRTEIAAFIRTSDLPELDILQVGAAALQQLPVVDSVVGNGITRVRIALVCPVISVACEVLASTWTTNLLETDTFPLPLILLLCFLIFVCLEFPLHVS